MELLFTSQNATNAANSDLAFWADLAFAGNYNGFRTFDNSRPASPTLVANVACLGPQDDVSGGTETATAKPTCCSPPRPDLGGRQVRLTGGGPRRPHRLEGIRTFDVSDPAAPRHIESVYQDCGSHTHTLVPDPQHHRVLLHVSSYPLRPGPTCGQVRGPAAGRDPLHGVIQVIEVSRDPNDPLGGSPPARSPSPSSPTRVTPTNRFVWSEQGLPGPRPSNPRRVPATTSACTLASCWPRPPAWSRRRCDGSTPRRCCPTPSSRCGFLATTPTATAPGGGDVAVDFWHTARFTWDGKFV